MVFGDAVVASGTDAARFTIEISIIRAGNVPRYVEDAIIDSFVFDAAASGCAESNSQHEDWPSYRHRRTAAQVLPRSLPGT
jgi:hypothetical protein